MNFSVYFRFNISKISQNVVASVTAKITKTPRSIKNKAMNNWTLHLLKHPLYLLINHSDTSTSRYRWLFFWNISLKCMSKLPSSMVGNDGLSFISLSAAAWCVMVRILNKVRIYIMYVHYLKKYTNHFWSAFTEFYLQFEFGISIISGLFLNCTQKMFNRTVQSHIALWNYFCSLCQFKQTYLEVLTDILF